MPHTGMAITPRTGHVWQGRFYSCPLDERHLWEALRYVSSIRCVREWWKGRSNGHGRALPPTANSRSLTQSWKWSVGESAGPRASGIAFSRTLSRRRNWLHCDALLTRVDPWEVRSSWPNWRLRCRVRSPREKEAATTNLSPTQIN